jgi:hypothetical protein
MTGNLVQQLNLSCFFEQTSCAGDTHKTGRDTVSVGKNINVPPPLVARIFSWPMEALFSQSYRPVRTENLQPGE